MAYNDDDFDEQDQQNPEGPKALREALEKQKKALADRDKKLNDALERIASFEQKERASTLENLLKTKNVDPKYARWASKDGIEPTEDAVSKWLEENKDLVPVSTATTTVSEPKTPQDGQQANPLASLPPEVQAVLAAMASSQAMEAEATSGLPVDPRAEEAVQASLAAVAQNAKSEADITAALKALGAPLVNVGR